MRLQAGFLDEAGLGAVLGMLEGGGFQAFVVGGAVRNFLLGIAISDIDLATDATPEVVTALAGENGLRALPTGIAHGTVTVLAGGNSYEVTTFRKDVETDGRHAQVMYTGDLAQDAARRDFTMNALYLSRKGELVDPLGGLEDLRARRLRFVGDATQRISEDYLRILRFFRFLAYYGDVALVGQETLDAIRDGKGGLAGISAERIGAEMRKLLAAPDPSASLALMEQVGLLPRIVPQGASKRVARLVKEENSLHSAPEWLRRLAVLGSDAHADALRLSRAEIRSFKALTAAREMTPEAAAYYYGADIARDACLLRIAAGGDVVKDWSQRIATARPLPVSARDFPALSGPTLGQALRYATQSWIESGFTQPKDKLVAGAMAFAHGKT